MKKLFLSLALVGVATFAFAQKKVVKSADKNFKKGELELALEEINGALQDPETKDDPNTVLLKAKIQTKMFEADEDFAATTVSTGHAALESFQQTMKMAGGDKDSKIGKEVYKEDLPGMPDNLRPFSLMSLKNAALNKASEAYEMEDFNMSYEFFNLITEIEPSDSSSNFNAGYLAYQELGNTEAAKKHFERLIKIKDYNKLTTYYFLIQIASSEEQNPEKAYEYVILARRDYPEDNTLAEFEVQLLLQMNKLEEALIAVKEALQDDPFNTGLLLRYGYLLEQSGDIDAALVEYLKAVEANPEFFEGNYYAGAIYLDKARSILAEVNNLSDEDWEKMASDMTKSAEDLYRNAIPYFTKASELKPDNTEILEILFQIHTRLKNNAEAELYNSLLTAILGPNWMDR